MTEYVPGQYAEITPDAAPAALKEPFRFTLDGKKFELPPLDSAQVPLELIPVFMLFKQYDTVQDVPEETRMQAAAAFVQYLQIKEPRLWATISKQKTPILWINGLIRQWGDYAGLEGKASSSGDS
jgi:hypothetical protein